MYFHVTILLTTGIKAVLYSFVAFKETEIETIEQNNDNIVAQNCKCGSNM